jgi:hypothetical protein
LEENSTEAANRPLKRLSSEGEVKNARYVQKPFSHIAHEGGNELQISGSSFNKYTPGEFKQPKKESDKCDFCEDAKEAVNSNAQLLPKLGIEAASLSELFVALETAKPSPELAKVKKKIRKYVLK